MIDHTGMDRSASYISALETGRSSPTLVELEQLSRYFRVTVIDLLQETMDAADRRGDTSVLTPQTDERLERIYTSLNEQDQALALEILESLTKHRQR